VAPENTIGHGTARVKGLLRRDLTVPTTFFAEHQVEAAFAAFSTRPGQPLPYDVKKLKPGAPGHQ